MAYELTTYSGLEGRCSDARKRHQKLDGTFSNARLYWQEIAEMFWPERATFTVSRTPGIDMQEGLFTSTPQMLSRDFANRLGSQTRPSSDEWFRLSARPEEMMANDVVRYWCDLVSRTQRRIIYDRRSNFTHTASVEDRDYVTFGNAVSWIAFNREQTGLIFRNIHLKDACWSENEEGMVDTLYQKMTIPLGHAVKLFGEDRMPREWKRRLEKPEGLYHDVELVRSASPVDPDSYESGKRPPASMRFAVQYFTHDCERDKESGALGEMFCREFPYHVRRWMPLGEPFGRSLCTNVGLADARTMNIADAAALKAIEMIADPPRWADDEAVISTPELIPGGITYIDGSKITTSRDPLGKIEGGDPRSVMEFLMYKRNSQALVWFENLWKFPEREMTAFETGERLEIMMQEATPVFQPVEADNSRLMDIVFSKGVSAGWFPKPPFELVEQGAVEWEFETPVTRSMRRVRAMKAQNILSTVAQTRPAIPEFGAQVNMTELEREWLAGSGPENWIKSREQVAQEAVQAQEAAIAAERDEQMMRGAETIASARPENLRLIDEAIAGDI